MTIATSLCRCLEVTPFLGGFQNSGVSTCLQIALPKTPRDLPSVPFPTTTTTTACGVDPNLFGVGCDSHWESVVFPEGGAGEEDDDWKHQPWCFVDPDAAVQCSDSIPVIALSIDFDGVASSSNNWIESQSLALSYSACHDNDKVAHNDETLQVEEKQRLRGGNNIVSKAAASTSSVDTTTSEGTSSSLLGWEFAGPSGYVKQFGNAPKLISAGAVQAVAEGPKGTWFMASVNGGVWRTTTLGESKPHWENVLDGQPVTCSSMSALHVSKSNPKRIYAGCGGSTSSEQGSDWNVVNSGDWGGLMLSNTGGDSWQMMTGFPINYYITDIVEIDNDGNDILLVSAQSHLFDRDDGGIWQSIDGGLSFEKVDPTPTFTLTVLEQGNVLATHTRSSKHSISLSVDKGKTFQDLGQLPWDEGASPFYTCATELGNGRLVVAGLTRISDSQGYSAPNQTDSQFFISHDDTLSAWSKIDQPTRMDEDSMPKDRMAILADPQLSDLMYVAGNAGALAWRVNTTTGTWTKMWDQPEVVDGSVPHGDCRNYAWDSTTTTSSDDEGRLLLVTDGGIFAREQPRKAGGKWISLNGDYSSLELLSAHYDPKNDRYVGGAQDNCAVVTKINSTPDDIAHGFVEGDGTVTLVDSNATPSRLFGTTQFMGVGTIENDPTTTMMSQEGDDDDDDCGGLCFVQGDKFIEVEIDKYFSEPSTFPFFVHPYTLNRQNPTLLHVWTNGTGPERPSAFYQFSIPYSVKDKDDIEAPTKLLESPPGAMILDFVSGGYTAGEPDPNLILAISNTHLYIHSNTQQRDNRAMIERPLPLRFAVPVTLEYDYGNQGARILGPLTHARTVSFAVSPGDSGVIALTGWTSIDSNLGNEDVFITKDTGRTWQNITGNLRVASGVSGKVRPGGLRLVDLTDDGDKALLAGTSDGILITFIASKNTPTSNAEQHWTRFGSHKEFPIVLTADVDYEPLSDRLVAATFGRGIYILKDAKQKLLNMRAGMLERRDTTVSSN